MTGLGTRVETQPAQVESVYNVRIGAVLAATLAPGATTISVDDTDRFVDGGGWVALETADDVFIPADAVAGTDAYFDRPSSIGVGYDSVDRIANTLHLVVPWDATFPTFAAGDSVWVDPPAMDRRAEVLLDGDATQTVTARIPFALAAQLPEGVRDPREGEWCRVEITDAGFEVIDVVNEEALIAADVVEVGEDESADAVFDTITVDEVVSPSVPRRTSDDLLLYVDALLGSDDNAGDAVFPLLDTFERSVVNGWGTADVGGTWGQVQYQGPNQPDVGQLVAGAARLRVNGASQSNIMVTNDFAVLSGEASAGVAWNSVPTNGAVYHGIGRFADSASGYVGAILLASTGVLTLTIGKKLAGSWVADLASTALGSGYVAGTIYRVRVQVAANPDGGTDVRAKAWKETDAEPEAWMLELNDTSGGTIATVSRWGAMQRSGSGFTVGTMHAAFHDYAVAAIDADGSVIDTTEGGVGPLATLAAALDHLGSWNDGEVRIVLIGDANEDLEIDGLAGGGRVVIDGGGVGVLYGRVRLYGVHQFMELRDFTQQFSGESATSGVDLRTSQHVECINLKMQGNGVGNNGIIVAEGSVARVEGCQINGYTLNCVQALEGSTAVCVNNLGAGGSTSSYRAASSIIYVDGSKPTGATFEATGGLIRGTTTSNAAGTPPPTSNRKTSTHSANSTKTWRPAWGWKDGDDAIQGEWQGSGGLSRGTAFYGTALRRPGRTAISAKVFVRRLGSGGPGGKQDIFLAVHPEEKQPGGGAGPGISAGPTRIGALANGEGKWFDVPKSFAQSVMTGGGRGFMLYHGSPSPYVIAVGRRASKSNFQVKITHQ